MEAVVHDLGLECSGGSGGGGGGGSGGSGGCWLLAWWLEAQTFALHLSNSIG